MSTVFLMSPERHAAVSGATAPHAFTTTHWSVVLAASQAASPAAATALEELCRTYWYPLYAFVRRTGHGPHDAQELTHFLADEWDKARRLKRGGGQGIISFDAVSAEERYRLEPIDQLDAAKLY